MIHQLDQSRSFSTYRPEKVKSRKIFSMRDMAICSLLIFAAGLSLGIGIMQSLS